MTNIDNSGAEQRAKIAEKLTAGITVFTAVIAVAAGYRDGLARMALNDRTCLAIALGLVLLSILLATAAWMTAHHRPTWAILSVLALLSSVGGTAVGLVTATASAVAYDRPQVGVSYDGQKLTFSAEIALLPSNGRMTVRVNGYPAGAGSAGSELFFAATGPAPDGTAKLAGGVVVAPTAYEMVEVRAYRSGEDPNCLRPLAERQDRAACATVWLQPRTP